MNMHALFDEHTDLLLFNVFLSVEFVRVMVRGTKEKKEVVLFGALEALILNVPWRLALQLNYTLIQKYYTIQ